MICDSRHLVVDGHNLVHSWCRRKRLGKRDLEAEMERLVARVRVLHDVQNWAVTVVFDGNRERLSVEHPLEETTFTVVYAAREQTADAVIERLLERAPNPAQWALASDDRALVHHAISRGAEVFSGEGTARWIDRVEGVMRDRLARGQARTERAWGKPEIGGAE